MPGYQVKQERIAIAGVADLHIRSLLDREQFFDPFGEAAAQGISSAAWPLFGLLWPSALQLAAHMGQRPVLVDERILEIGCGLGLASLVSHRKGADVTASDRHPLAEAFLCHNAVLNGLQPPLYCHGRWGAPLGAAAGAVVLGRYDLVIASDVLYERDDAGDLPRFIGEHVQARAEVLVVDPDRGNRPAFSRRMLAMGFVLDQTRLGPAASGLPAYKGRLLRYQRADVPA